MNVLIHEYFGVDNDFVCNVIDKELPPLKDKIMQLLC
ncbi:HepT-like ribonuclease domain-containing protein [Salibacterium halotolerans]